MTQDPRAAVQPQMINIGPIVKGVNQYADSSEIPDDSFSVLEHLYPYRGELCQMQGSTNQGRLRRTLSGKSYFDSGASPWSFNILVEWGYITNIDVSGSPTLVITTNGPHGLSNADNVAISDVVGTAGADINGNTYAVANVTATTFEITQATAGAYTSGGLYISDRSLSSSEPNAEIQCGSFSMVVDPSGTPETITDDGAGVLTGSISATGTINYASGAITLTGASGSSATTITYNYYPGLPVMGLYEYAQAYETLPELIGFDTKYAYILTQTTLSWSQRGTKKWDGGDADFFLSYVYSRNTASGADFRQIVSNFDFQSTNPSSYQYWDGTDWAAFAPAVTSTENLYSSQFLVDYHGRLVALDTFEGATIAGAERFQNRLRASAFADPFGATAWRGDQIGQGYGIDAPTSSTIRTIGFHNEQLIIGFASGESYYIVYTGNDVYPFIWQHIEDSEQPGGNSPFGSVDFDEGVMMIGSNGIAVANSRGAQRIDESIPDFGFSIRQDSDGPQRVHSVKDTQRQLIYITYPRSYRTSYFPDRMLCYNYQLRAWSYLYGQWTCFGYINRTESNAVTWDTIPAETWDDWTTTWGYPRQQSGFQDIVAGNQHGYVHLINNEGENDESLAITGMANSADASSAAVLTITDHGLDPSETGVGVITGIEGSTEDKALNSQRVRIFYVSSDTVGIQTLVDGEWDNYVLENTAYIGCGRFAWVYGFRLQTKTFNPYLENGYSSRIQYLDYRAQEDNNALFTYYVYGDSQLSTPMNLKNVASVSSRSYLPSGEEKSWNRIDVNQEGQYVTLEMTQSEEQLGISDNSQYRFILSRLKIHIRPGRKLL